MSDLSRGEVGDTVAVPAFTGMYPLCGGWGNWELWFTRYRLLTHQGDLIQEWVALSGPTRGRLLREDPASDIEIITSRRRYDRVLLAGRVFWVHFGYRGTLRAWGASSTR